jgi:predicted GH43/DUF377 family glycosyl hydrolase
MYYAGCDINEYYEIGYAESTDGITWTKPDLGGGDNICLTYGAAASWNEGGVMGPHVIKISPTEYHMWFSGYDNSIDFQIGYATSSDGKTWTPNAGPVLSPTGGAGDFDESSVLDVSVLREGSTLHVWYTGTNPSGEFAVGYTSTTTAAPDTLTNASGPIAALTPLGGSYFAGGVRAPNTILDSTDSKYRMWPTAYNGSIDTITLAESSAVDTGWLINNTPVLLYHTTGFDVIQVGLCSVVENPAAAGYQMWYTGWSTDGLAIGYATSDDGISWTKHR